MKFNKVIILILSATFETQVDGLKLNAHPVLDDQMLTQIDSSADVSSEL